MSETRLTRARLPGGLAVPPATCPHGHALTWRALRFATCLGSSTGVNLTDWWWYLGDDGKLEGPSIYAQEVEEGKE